MKSTFVIKPHQTMGHMDWVTGIAHLPGGRRIITSSIDGSLLLWNIEGGVLVSNWRESSLGLWSIALSPNGRTVASGSSNGTIKLWDIQTGNVVAVYTATARSLCWSVDGERVVSGSNEGTIRVWDVKSDDTVLGPIVTGHQYVYAVMYSPDTTKIATGGYNENALKIWDANTGNLLSTIKHTSAVWSLTWTSDQKKLITGANNGGIRIFDTATWQQIAILKGHTHCVKSLSLFQNDRLLASGSLDHTARLWNLDANLPVGLPIRHENAVHSAAISTDGKLLVTGCGDKNAYLWDIHSTLKDAGLEKLLSIVDINMSKIIPLSMPAFNACILGDLTMAEDILTQEIGNDADNYNSYACRSFVMARKSDWDRALHDALKSIDIQPSLTGYIAKGVVLCGKANFQDAAKAFDIAFMFTDGDSKTMNLLLLVKAIALFNAKQHEEAMSHIKELVTACPNADKLACSVVETYLRVQLGVCAPDHNEAANHFTAAVESIHFSSQSAIHSKYEVLVLLFGWDLKFLWKTANQNRCNALLRAGRITEALKAYRYMTDMSDVTTRSDCIDWSSGFEKRCEAHCSTKGDAAIAAGNYEMAIELYSATIDLDFAIPGIFANRCNAKLEKKQWEEALVGAEKVIELDASSYIGYKLNQAALHGAQQYDEAIMAFDVMLSELDDGADMEIRKLRRQYVSSSEAATAIENVIHTRLDNTPHRLFNTFTGRLCDRGAQINAFKTSTEYNALLLLSIKDAEMHMAHIERVVVMYFSYAMLSHRWEENEALLQDIRAKVVYDFNPLGGVAKLRAFCRTARDAGCRWAWIDTCCIDQTNNVEVQKSVNSMFLWYRHSALTIVYLLDVPPSSKSGALAKSVWKERGWTIQEFLAPKVVLFYQSDWTLYLGDRSPNHKESSAIMQELAGATGIDPEALVAFRPEMKGAREKLQWASARVTTVQEDMAYSLFGIFGIHLPVIYGENKQNALGRLLQEIVARSGDISALEWVGKPSEFNSCLPADIASYKSLPPTLPSPSEDQIQTMISSLRKTVAVDAACKLYNLLENLSAPRFANCRLHLPCITFPVAQVIQDHARGLKVTYNIKVNGLIDLPITTEDKLPTRQKLLLVYPWNRDLVESLDIAEDAEIVDDYYATDATGKDEPSGTESHLRALRSIVLLAQPFRGFLLVRQRGGEYRRIASDYDIIAQVQDVTSVWKMSDVRIIEIL